MRSTTLSHGCRSGSRRRVLAVLRGALLQKGRDALTAIAVVKVANKVVAFAGKLLAQCVGRGIIDELLDAGQCVGRTGIETFCEFERFRQCRACTGHPVHQTKVVQPLGADTLAHGRIEESRIIARLPAATSVAEGPLPLRFDPANRHYFDRQNGARIEG